MENCLGTLVITINIAGAFDRVWCAGLLEKLCAKGIKDTSLLIFMSNCLQGRSFYCHHQQTTIQGPSSREASVSQGSDLRPVLQNLYIDGFLRNLPVVSAYADDCMLYHSYCCQDSQQAVADINQQLCRTEEWRARWQVNFAPEKTQATVVSQSLAALQAVDARLISGNTTLPLQDCIRILGVD